MITGLGVDIIEIDRIRAAIERRGDQFINKIFTKSEQVYCGDEPVAMERYAARFAAKEACLKALGTGLREGIHWTDIEVKRTDNGRPYLELSGAAAELQGTASLHLSMSHCKQYATATVILEA
jgi:holo-[acyl-carrier protein] synthase